MLWGMPECLSTEMMRIVEMVLVTSNSSRIVHIWHDGWEPGWGRAGTCMAGARDYHTLENS